MGFEDLDDFIDAQMTTDLGLQSLTVSDVEAAASGLPDEEVSALLNKFKEIQQAADSRKALLNTITMAIGIARRFTVG